MATTSPIPAVKVALRDALSDALPGVQVSYGYPGDIVESECVWIGGVRGRELLVTMSPARVQRDHDFDLELFFDALKLGATQEEAEARAFTFFAALEDVTADDPSLGGLISTGIYISTFEAVTALGQAGPVARITATVSFKTRLF